MPRKKDALAPAAREREGRSEALARRAKRNEAVAERGEAVRGRETVNRDKFGYSCPREHYIEGPGDLTVEAMALLWGVLPATLKNWIAVHRWEEKRLERMAANAIVPAEKMVQARLAQLQSEWFERKLTVSQSLIDQAMEMAKDTEEHLSPMGGKVELKLRVKSLKDLSAVVKEQGDIINAALRVPSKPPGGDEGGEDKHVKLYANFGVAFEVEPEAPRNGRPPRVIDALPMNEDG